MSTKLKILTLEIFASITTHVSPTLLHCMKRQTPQRRHLSQHFKYASENGKNHVNAVKRHCKALICITDQAWRANSYDKEQF